MINIAQGVEQGIGPTGGSTKAGLQGIGKRL